MGTDAEEAGVMDGYSGDSKTALNDDAVQYRLVCEVLWRSVHDFVDCEA